MQFAALHFGTRRLLFTFREAGSEDSCVFVSIQMFQEKQTTVSLLNKVLLCEMMNPRGAAAACLTCFQADQVLEKSLFHIR